MSVVTTRRSSSKQSLVGARDVRAQTLTDSPVHRRKSRHSAFVEGGHPTVLTVEKVNTEITKIVKVPGTHPDGHGIVVEAREMFLHADKVVNISLQVAPPEAILGRRLKDGQVRLDASHLSGLHSISGEMTPHGPTFTALTILDLSGSGIQCVDSPIFQCCPTLRDLCLRRCPPLRVVTALEEAKNLRYLRAPNCSALHTVECAQEGTVAAPRLELLDLHGSMELRGEDIWALLSDRIQKSDIPVRGVPLEFIAWCPLKHTLVPNEVGFPGPWKPGATVRCDVCTAEIPKQGLMRSCQSCNIDVCEKCCKKDFYRPAPCVVWPSNEDANEFLETLELGKTSGLQPSELQEAEKNFAQEHIDTTQMSGTWLETQMNFERNVQLQLEKKENEKQRKVAARARLEGAVKSRDIKDLKKALAEGRDAGLQQDEMAAAEKVLDEQERNVAERFKEACREGVRLRLRHALEWSRGPWSQTGCSARRAKDVKAEIRSALKRAEEDLPMDLPLWRALFASEAQGGAAHCLQGKTFKCPYNCGAGELKAGSENGEEYFLYHVDHVCMEGKEYCESSGMYIRRKYKEQHEEIRKEIEAAMASWDAAWLKAALKAAEDAGEEGRRMPRILMTKAEAVRWELEQKYKLVKPALASGSISIDFKTKQIALATQIAFEARQPPDSSATFDPDSEAAAQSILDDIATAMKAYKIHFIVEGQSGNGNPPEFYQELADGRAALICDCLESRGVQKELLHPRGNPSGTPQVVIIAMNDPEPSEDDGGEF